MNGEKSDVGIVANKLARKAAKASELACFFLDRQYELRLKRRRLVRSPKPVKMSNGVKPCARQEPGSHEVRRTGE